MSVAQTVDHRIGGQRKGRRRRQSWLTLRHSPTICLVVLVTTSTIPDRTDGLQVMLQTRDLQNTRNVRYLLLHAISLFLPHAVTVKVSDENRLVLITDAFLGLLANEDKGTSSLRLPLEHKRYEEAAAQSHKCTTDLLLFINNQKKYNL